MYFTVTCEFLHLFNIELKHIISAMYFTLKCEFLHLFTIELKHIQGISPRENLKSWELGLAEAKSPH